MKGVFQQEELDALKTEAASLLEDVYGDQIRSEPALEDVRRFWASKGIESMAAAVQAPREDELDESASRQAGAVA